MDIIPPTHKPLPILRKRFVKIPMHIGERI